jgi:glycerol uptake facilitator protein
VHIRASLLHNRHHECAGLATVKPSQELGKRDLNEEKGLWMNLGAIFLSEVVGTAMLLLLGCGVVATAILVKSKGFGGGWLLINFGWGIAVFAGVTVAYYSGAHLNPAVTLGLLVAGKVTGGFGAAIVYWVGELVGAFIGAVLAWLAFKKHFDEEVDPGAILGVFSTGPAIRSYAWNLVTEIIGTFVLVFVVLAFGHWGDPGTKTPAGLASLGALPVSLLVVGIGASLGGPTGYAINPARDLGPRVAHALLPIPNKGSSDWAYSWVPIVGPLIGGLLAGLLSYALPNV